MDLYKNAQQLRARLDQTPFETLSPKEQVLLSIVELEVEVNNGGFDQYYLNTSGELANFAPDALKIIGAFRAADIVQRANAIWEKPVPSDRNIRIDFLVSLSNADQWPWEELDNEFYEYPDDLARLLQAFWEAP